MTNDFFFLVAPFLILIAWLFPYCRKLFKGYKSELFSLLAAYYWLLADIKSSNGTKVIADKTWIELNTLLIIIGALLTLTAIVLSSLQKQKEKSHDIIVSELTNTKIRLEKIKDEYYNLCSDNIKVIFESFFTSSGGNGRVSLYKHEGTCFKLLGRFANNPIYNKKGREIYPVTEGFIYKGWCEGSFGIHNAPNWSARGTEYKNFMKDNCTISDDSLKKITMKSRSFYVYRLDNQNAQTHHGIIVFEKMSETQILPDAINTIFDNHRAQIVFLVKSLKSLN